MWLDVAFPRCPNPHCNSTNFNQCYHKDCPNGGNRPMEINSETEMVKCPSCGRSWDIRDSEYYCSCGYIFSADEVEEEVNAIIANAKLIAKELNRSAATRNRIAMITDNIIADVAADTIKKSFGQKVWDLLKSAIPSIIKLVKAWIGL